VNDLPNTPPPPVPLTTGQIIEHLEYVLEPLLRRRDRIVAALLATAAAYPEILDDEAMGEAGENLRMVSALTRLSEDRRKEHKDPYWSGGRTVDAWFKNFFAPLNDAKAPVQRAADAYAAMVVRREREATAAAAAAARQAADRAAEAAALAIEERREIDAQGLVEAAREADRLQAQADARPAEMSRTHGEYGAVISARSTWRFKVIDLAQVPREYLMIDTNALKAAMADRDAAGRPTAVIAGVEWVEDISAGVR
jgi:hypothetical protein